MDQGDVHSSCKGLIEIVNKANKHVSKMCRAAKCVSQKEYSILSRIQGPMWADCTLL